MAPIPSPLKPEEFIRKLDRDAKDRVSLAKMMNDLMKIHKDFMAKADDIAMKVSSIKQGAPGVSIPGRPGRSPSREELLAIIRPLIPKVRNGKDADEDRIARKVLALLPPIRDGRDSSPEEVAEHIKKGRKLTVDDIAGLRQNLSQIRGEASKKGYLHGGGDTIRAGAGVTLTRNSDGTTTISAVSSGLGIETPVGAVDGSNTSYTVSNEPLFIMADGMVRFEGEGYTYLAGTITMDALIPPVEYIRSVY